MRLYDDSILILIIAYLQTINNYKSTITSYCTTQTCGTWSNKDHNSN